LFHVSFPAKNVLWGSTWLLPSLVHVLYMSQGIYIFQGSQSFLTSRTWHRTCIWAVQIILGSNSLTVQR
jgi:hypothetical protein